MVDQIRKIVAELPDRSDVTDILELADQRFAEGDIAFVADLGVALEKRYGRDSTVRHHEYVFDHLLRLLATNPGRENLVQALRLLSSTRASGRRMECYAASMLASSHPPEDLAVVFRGGAGAGGSEELRACLVHELLLRGVPVTEAPGVGKWAASPHWRYHPLRWLPLTLSEFEKGPLTLPTYEVYGYAGGSLPWRDPTFQGAVLRRGAGRVPSVTETTTPARASAIATAVVNWVEHSLGKIEARTFDLAEPIDDDSVPSTLFALGLVCLDGVKRDRGYRVFTCQPTYAWHVLFAAAANGGVYGAPSFGAYGRLKAWQSLAALTGLPEGASAGEVEGWVRACSWYGFDADTKWFQRVAYDFGLVVLTPDRRHLAVLAATDTD